MIKAYFTGGGPLDGAEKEIIDTTKRWRTTLAPPIPGGPTEGPFLLRGPAQTHLYLRTERYTPAGAVIFVYKGIE